MFRAEAERDHLASMYSLEVCLLCVGKSRLDLAFLDGIKSASRLVNLNVEVLASIPMLIIYTGVDVWKQCGRTVDEYRSFLLDNA
jgi:hypothetical protein